MKIQETKSIVTKGFHGWTAKTTTTVNGNTFEISTCKTYNGNITSTAMKVEKEYKNGIFITSFDSQSIFNSIKLLSVKARATEKTIREQHAKAVILFDEKVNNNEIEAYKKEVIEIGDIIFLDGYGKTKGCKGNNHIVYDIQNGYSTFNYFTVDPDTLKLDTKQYIKPFSKKFGIGNYFEKGYNLQSLGLSNDDLNNLVIEAKEKQKEDKKKEEAEKLMNEQIIKGKIEEGKKHVNIPDWAKSVIVADLYQDDSDSMTDYFSTSVSNVFYLAFSKTTRNNMNELYKAAENWKETKELLEDDNTEEYTSGHSYLPDYYLGSSRWHGLKVNKRKYFDLTKEENRNKLYIAHSEGRYFVPKQKTNKVKSDLQYIDYSERAFAIIGDTKPIKDILKSLGGKFNFRLKCGAGWIFPKTKETEVKTKLKLL